MAVSDCSVTERRRWRPPYQTGKTVHVHAKHYKHNEDGRTAPGVCDNGSVRLSVAQSVGHLTRKSGVLGSIPGLDNILSFLLPLFQEGPLSVTGESMCTKYWLTA